MTTVPNTASAQAGDAARARPVCLACHGTLDPRPALRAPDRMYRLAGEWSVHVCGQCGSGTTLPLAQEHELEAFYPAAYAPFEVRGGPVAAAMDFIQRRRNRRFPLSRFSSPTAGAPGRLLDVGCGRGDLAASWLDAGWQVQGVEPSPDAAAIAARRGIEVLPGTLSTVELEPASLDAVVFSHSLEHVVDPQADLRRVHDALRPGRRVAVLVPNWGSWQRRAFGQYWFPLELPRHRTHFTAAGLSAALDAAGFEQVEIRPGSPLITTTWSLQFRLFDRLLTDHGKALLAGYGVAAPIASVVLGIDRALRSGDFLHAAAARSAG